MKLRDFFRLRKFTSAGEYFRAVENAVTELRRAGYQTAAAQVEVGYGYLNGLTDGWGLLLEAIEKTLAALPADASAEIRQHLVDIRDGAYDAVYRR